MAKQPNRLCPAFITFIMFWIIFAPISISLWILTFPFKICIRRPKKEIEIVVEITEPLSGGPPKDEILLIPGFPDCVRLWDKQVEALSADGYRCIAVTIPNYGKENNSGHWGYTFDQITTMLANVILKHSHKKKVSLLLHDFGSFYGMNLAMDRPELVSRIATLDIGGHFDSAPGYKLFSWSYQIFFAMLFLMGDPVGGWMFRFLMKKSVKHRDIKEIRP
jgi:pimeloyl-ACP methyl ester carboxylesterase